MHFAALAGIRHTHPHIIACTVMQAKITRQKGGRLQRNDKNW
jgi:hypothetical protein